MRFFKSLHVVFPVTKKLLILHEKRPILELNSLKIVKKFSAEDFLRITGEQCHTDGWGGFCVASDGPG